MAAELVPSQLPCGDKSFGGGKGDVFTLLPLAHSNMINVL